MIIELRMPRSGCHALTRLYGHLYARKLCNSVQNGTKLDWTELKAKRLWVGVSLLYREYQIEIVNYEYN